MTDIWEVWCKRVAGLSLAAMVLVFSISWYIYSAKDGQMVIPFNNSISFDAKLYVMKHMDKQHFDYIAVGSSMTLNNLNSKKMAEYLNMQEKTFYNFSSWGMKIKTTDLFAKMLAERYKPEAIIVFSSVGDFYTDGMELTNFDDIKLYLDYDSKLLETLYVLKYQGLMGKSDKDFELRKQRIYDYDSLAFDANGGVPLNVSGEHISPERWNMKLEYKFQEDNVQYQYLRDLSAFCKMQKIKLFFVQTPYKVGAITPLIEVRKHGDYCKAILEQDGNVFYEADADGDYEEQSFSDYLHLNEAGSAVLTEKFIRRCLLQ